MDSSTVGLALLRGETYLRGTQDTLNKLMSLNGGGSTLADYHRVNMTYAAFLQDVGVGLISIQPENYGYEGPDGWVPVVPYQYAQSGTGSDSLVVTSLLALKPSLWELTECGELLLNLPPGTVLLPRHPDHQHLKLTKEDFILSEEQTEIYTRQCVFDSNNPTCSTYDDNDAECTGQEIDNVCYCITGVNHYTYSVNQKTNLLANIILGSTPAVLSILFRAAYKKAFKQLFGPVLKSGWNGCKYVWAHINDSGGTPATIEVLDNAKPESLVEEETPEGMLTAESIAGAASFGLILASAAIAITIKLLEHYSTLNLYIANVSSKYDAVWYPTYNGMYLANNALMSTAPVINSEDENSPYQTLISGVRLNAPKSHSQPLPHYYQTTFTFVSHGQLEGLGISFVLYLFPLNGLATNGDFYSGQEPTSALAFAVNIPWGSANSINVSQVQTTTNGLPGNMSPAQYYYADSQMTSENSVTVQMPNLGLTATISIDYIHENQKPESAQGDYTYTVNLNIYDTANS